MTLHAATFLTYNIVVIVLFVGHYFYTVQTNDATAEQKKQVRRVCLIAWICTSYANFLAQLCMIWIFLQFRHRSEPDRATRVTRATRMTEDFDE